MGYGAFGLGRSGHAGVAGSGAGRGQSGVHLHPGGAAARRAEAPCLSHRPGAGPAYASGPAGGHRLDHRAHRAPVQLGRSRLFRAGSDPGGRRPVSASQGHAGTARTPGRPCGRSRGCGPSRGLLAGDRADHRPGRRFFPGFHHHLRGHGGPCLGDDAGRGRGHAGHGSGRRAAAPLCGAPSLGHRALSGLSADDRPGAADRRPGLPYSQGLSVRGHYFRRAGGSLQSVGAAQPAQAHQHARHARVHSPRSAGAAGRAVRPRRRPA